MVKDCFIFYFIFLSFHIFIYMSLKKRQYFTPHDKKQKALYLLWLQFKVIPKKIVNQREKFSGACFANLLLPNFVRNIEFNFCKIFSPLDLNYWSILSIVLSSNLSQQKASFIVHHCSLFLYFNLWSWHHCIK